MRLLRSLCSAEVFLPELVGTRWMLLARVVPPSIRGYHFRLYGGCITFDFTVSSGNVLPLGRGGRGEGGGGLLLLPG